MRKNFKAQLFFTLVLFAAFSLSSSILSHAKGKVVITLNLKDCNNCVNHLALLQKLDKSIPVYFVLQKNLEPDSSDIIESFDLGSLEAQFIWSDSLYNASLSSYGGSTLSYFNSTGENAYSFSLKEEMNLETVNYINNFEKASTKFSFDRREITAGTNNTFYQNGRYYILDNLKNEVRAIDLRSGKRLFVVKPTDSISQLTFNALFKDTKIWKRNSEMIKNLNYSRYRTICNFVVTKSDEVYLAIEHKVVVTNPSDTIIMNLYSIEKYDNKGIISDYKVFKPIKDRSLFELTANDVLYDTTGVNFHPYSMFVQGDEIIVQIVTNSRQIEAKQYLIGKFRNGDNHVLTYDQAVDVFMPKVYDDYGNSFVDLRFTPDGRFFYLGLEDKLFSLSRMKTDVDLKIFKQRQYAGDPFDFKYLIRLARSDKDYAYILWYNKQSNKVFYDKYSFASETIVEEKEVACDLKLANFIIVDDFDYNCLLIPTSDKEILRQQMFD